VRTGVNTCKQSARSREVKQTCRDTEISLRFLEDRYSVSTGCRTTQKEHKQM